MAKIASELLIGPILFMEADPVQNRAKYDAQVFSCDPCALALHQILHLDLDIQYSPKIPKSQELVKFDKVL